MQRHSRRQVQWWRSPVPYTVVATWTAATAVWTYLAVRRVEAFNQAVQSIEQCDGFVHISTLPRSGAAFLAGLEVAQEVREIRFRSSQLDELPSLAPFNESLDTLDFSHCHLSSKAFAQLGSAKKLSMLHIQYCQLDRGLFSTANVSLDYLNLSKSTVTDETIQELKHWQFNQLNLAGTSVTDEGIWSLFQDRALTGLHLENTAVGDASIAQMPAAWKDSLYYLDLSGTKVTDASLRALAGFSKLDQLTLQKTGVTADGVAKFLTENRGLQKIDLRDTAITDEEHKQLRRIAGATAVW